MQTGGFFFVASLRQAKCLKVVVKVGCWTRPAVSSRTIATAALVSSVAAGRSRYRSGPGSGRRRIVAVVAVAVAVPVGFPRVVKRRTEVVVVVVRADGAD